MAESKLVKVPFDVLWKNYPSDPPCVDREGRVPHGWDNQCAVRVGVALEKSGVSFASLSAGGRCPEGMATGGMVGNAERLAGWLKEKRRFNDCGARQVLKPATWQADVSGRTGIIFFRNYWRRATDGKQPTGDHIDLWNRSRLTSTLLSFMRFTLDIPSFPNLNPMTRGPHNENWYSDLGGSSEVWFWRVP